MSHGHPFSRRRENSYLRRKQKFKTGFFRSRAKSSHPSVKKSFIFFGKKCHIKKKKIPLSRSRPVAPLMSRQVSSVTTLPTKGGGEVEITKILFCCAVKHAQTQILSFFSSLEKMWRIFSVFPKRSAYLLAQPPEREIQKQNKTKNRRWGPKLLQPMSHSKSSCRVLD